MNSTQAKNINLPDLLAKLGFQPTEISKAGNEYWYTSPFRSEKTASFHTSFLGGKWIWKDFGDIGGTVIDFVLRYKGFYRVNDALQFLDEIYQGSVKTIPVNPNQNSLFGKSPRDEKPVLELKNVSPLQKSWPYVQGRGINETVAKAYLNDIEFVNRNTGKTYFAAGIKNLSEGFEIRNPFFKSSIGKKDMTLIRGEEETKVISVFEGFMDFLTYLTEEGVVKPKEDILVLNSLSFQQRARDFIEKGGYERVLTFFDNDQAGSEAAKDFKKVFQRKIEAQNIRYKSLKDYNSKYKYKGSSF
ncbi:MAG: toprim domain-containing protein [Haliscomenobacter sp.]|uniref:toprim domain-containing protein n=1 Tax=Haliscomenobacter sp. TaxID=2717303 RepID=UPI0029A276C0|nr:toprim domain-containing protein [Haliscomenobacter sp.]MDX2068215.1 toprim domain-containing protein [Haliscomenobacter sp.]